MIVIVDERELVLKGYGRGFGREGVASVGFHPEEFRNWLEATPESELAAIEAVLLGGGPECGDLASVVRRRIQTPIIALSDMNSLNEVLELFSVGVDDVVRKPVHVREIMARVNAIMSRMRADDGAMVASDIKVFPDGRTPLVGGEPMQLPRREYRILHYLVTHHDRRVTKRQLFDYVYGIFEDNVEEAVIESHISKLRKKLRNRLGYDPIDSKRYLGYCLHSQPRRQARGKRSLPDASREPMLQTA